MDKVKKELFFCVFFVPLYLLVYTLLLNTTHGFFYPLTQKMSFWPHLFVTGYRSPFFIKKRGCCEPVKFCLLADLFCLFDITFFFVGNRHSSFYKKNYYDRCPAKSFVISWSAEQEHDSFDKQNVPLPSLTHLSLKAHWQISENRCLEKYCSCDQACQVSAL